MIFSQALTLMICFVTNVVSIARDESDQIIYSDTREKKETNLRRPNKISKESYNITFGKPRLILHVGPRKTGSSAIQALIHDNLLMLNEQENIFWPTTVTMKANGLSDFALHYLPNEGRKFEVQGQEMKEFLADCIQQNRDVIMSAEAFSYVNKRGLYYLKSLVEGFHVTIVYVYRELLNLFISQYNQLIKKMTIYSDFGTYLYENFDIIRKEAYMTLSNYEEVFDKKNIKIIDFYGTFSYATDVPSALYCNIIKPACQMQEQVPTTIKNVREDTTLQELTGALILVSKTNKCEFTPHYHGRHAGIIIPACTNGTKTFHSYDWPAIPYMNTDILKSLLSASHELDRYVRSYYKNNILYGNITANYEAAEKCIFETKTVDRNAILNDEKWIKVLSTVVKECEQMEVCIRRS